MAKDFSAVINEIMPLVLDGDKSTPFIITRDSAYGDWQVCYPYPAENADSFFKSQREIDHLAVMFTGADFAKGSFAYVYDKVLYARLREEYYVARSSGLDTDELLATTCFMQDHISEFSHKATAYLTTLDRPLAELTEMCPYSMTTDDPDLSYDEDLAFDAIHFIENEVNDRLHTYPDEYLPEPRNINGYEELHSVQIAGRLVILAENTRSDVPYMVCEGRSDNVLGVMEYRNINLTYDYLEAMRGFVDAVDSHLITLENERDSFGLAPITLTAADCVPGDRSPAGGLNENLKDKLIVIAPEVLAREYRTAEHQLKICVGGFGASPDSRGNAVFCKDLYSGKESRFERYDVLGVADIEKLPQWAKVKLAEQRGDELPPIALPKVQSEKPKQKPSLHDNLERNKARAARDNAARQDKPAKKRGDMEVE